MSGKKVHLMPRGAAAPSTRIARGCSAARKEGWQRRRATSCAASCFPEGAKGQDLSLTAILLAHALIGQRVGSMTTLP